MNATKIVDNVCQLSVNIEDILFEGLWEMPNGTSINSYIVKGEKTALIDGVCGWDGVPENLLALLDKLEIDPQSIEYLVVNHMEPDHSGWLEAFKKIKPDFKIVCSAKGAELLEAFYNHSANVTIVKDKDILDLGNGHVLEFVDMNNVHWPDTIGTFDRKTGVLFSCDAFGSFGTVNESGYDDLLTEEDLDFYEKEAVRYYSNIIGSFSLPVKKAIEKCKNLPIKIIAPGHGIVWRKNPQRIIDDYTRYVDYQKGVAKKEITLIWGSMYGMTEKAANYVIEELKKYDVKVNVHRVPEDSWGTILTSVWTSTGVILAMPTYEYKMFPPMAAALEELGKKKAVGRKALRLGSYGWSGGAQKELDEIMDKYKMNWEFVEAVEFKGSPSKDDLNLIGQRVKELVDQVSSLV